MAKPAEEVWARLLTGKPLDGLGLELIDGRFDLRRLKAPEPTIVRQYSTPHANIQELAGLVGIVGAHWRGIDFSHGQLRSFRFFDCVIEDCVFDGARCRDWRMWGTTVSNTRFVAADLREALLGSVSPEGRRNAFHAVDFTKADLRDTVHLSADYTECKFVDSRLDGVNFGGSVFVNTVFAGQMKEVFFYRQTSRGEQFPPNEMKGVDLREARLVDVEFRDLDMRAVQWPQGDDHILVEDYANTLDRVIDALKPRTDLAARTLVSILSMKRKWVGKNQAVGIISKADLVAAGGPDAVDEFVQLSKK